MSNMEIATRIIMWLGITLMYFTTYYSVNELVEIEKYIEAIQEQLQFIALAVYAIALSLIFHN